MEDFEIGITLDELYELYVTATNEVATLKDENKVLQKELDEIEKQKELDEIDKRMKGASQWTI